MLSKHSKDKRNNEPHAHSLPLVGRVLKGAKLGTAHYRPSRDRVRNKTKNK